MPANLSPEYREAEAELKRAQTPHEKLAALKAMLSAIPKHKGTEKMQADLKRRIASLKDDVKSAGKKKGFAVHVEKHGGAQVAIVGAPNTGKTQLVAALTDTELEVGNYPFTTRMPTPAMMPFEDIQIQLVDLPAVSSTFMEPWLPGLVRNADAVLFVVDLASDELLDGIEDCLAVLDGRKIVLVGDASDADPWASVAEKQTWMVGTRADLESATDNLAVVRELYGERFTIDAVSGATGDGLEALRKLLFERLELVRVYSKIPQREPDYSRPFVLKRGSTLADLALMVHHDFAEKLKFARVWGEGKYDGQRINRDYVLGDKDVVEMHM